MAYSHIRTGRRAPLLGCILVALLAFLPACGGQTDDGEEDVPRDPNIGTTRLTVEELPPMPPLPEERRGRLVTQSAGDYDINGSWSTTAGLCEEAGVIEMYAGEAGYGTAVLLRMAETDRLGEYPIVAATGDFPNAPVALIAVQIFNDPDALGFQAYHGTLELTEFGESISGSFTSTLREISIDLLTHFVGVFEGVPVRELDASYCRTLADSTLSIEPDSGEGTPRD